MSRAEVVASENEEKKARKATKAKRRTETEDDAIDKDEGDASLLSPIPRCASWLSKPLLSHARRSRQRKRGKAGHETSKSD